MILVGDCRERLRDLPERSVQTCVTSPPYFGLRDYGHDGQIGLEPTPGLELNAEYAAMAEARIALEGRPGGRPAGHESPAVIDGQLGLL